MKTFEDSPRGLAEIVHRANWPGADLRWHRGAFLEPSERGWRTLAQDEMDYLISLALEFHAFGAERPQWPTIALLAEVTAALRTLEEVFVPADRELPAHAAMEAAS